MKYKRKQQYCDAIKWTGKNFSEIENFLIDLHQWHIVDVWVNENMHTGAKTLVVSQFTKKDSSRKIINEGEFLVFESGIFSHMTSKELMSYFNNPEKLSDSQDQDLLLGLYKPKDLLK